MSAPLKPKRPRRPRLLKWRDLFGVRWELRVTGYDPLNQESGGVGKGRG